MDKENINDDLVNLMVTFTNRMDTSLANNFVKEMWDVIKKNESDKIGQLLAVLRKYDELINE